MGGAFRLILLILNFLVNYTVEIIVSFFSPLFALTQGSTGSRFRM